jgi:hypothetical protein
MSSKPLGLTTSISELVRNYKTRIIRMALTRSHGNIREAARQCGENPQRLQRWVHALGLGDFAADLRRGHAWWLVRRSVLVGAFFATCFYAARPMI